MRAFDSIFHINALCILLFALVACSSNKGNESRLQNQGEDFEEFYQRFSTDSLFQIKRIEFPVHGRYMDNELAGIVESDSMIWTTQNWRMIHSISKDDMAYIKATLSVNDSMASLRFEGVDFGFLNEQTFKLKDGKWYLIGLNDISL